MPSFLIIGAQKAGTSALFEYLAEHPRVAVGRFKEIEYFSYHFDHSMRWYRSHFPIGHEDGRGRLRGPRHITGEASTDYLLHPRAAFRVAELMPAVKVIALLRDPVARAYSHYHHERALGFETLSFEEALQREPIRIAGELERLRTQPDYIPFRLRHFSYLERGMYAPQLERWLVALPREQILVVPSEELFERPEDTYRTVLGFLELPEFRPTMFSPRNGRSYPGLDSRIRGRLDSHFAAANQRLSELVGRRLPW